MRPGPGALPHQPGQRGQRLDRRVDAAGMQVSAQHQLALGDVAGQVGHRVSDVPGRHGQHRDQGEGAGQPADAPAPLIQRSQVTVEVSGVSAPRRDLAAGRRHLPQRLAVVGHVGHHHEHVPSERERQMLGDRQRQPRREQPLDDRRVGQVQQQHELARGGALFQRAADRRGVGMGEAHRCEHHAERLAARRGLRGQLAGQLQVRQAGRPRRWAASGRGPSVVSASITDTPVSTGSAGGSRAAGLIGYPATGAVTSAGDRRAAVDRLAEPVADPAEPAFADADPQRAAAELDPVAGQAHPGGALQHLDDGQVTDDLQHQSVPDLAGLQPDRGELVPAHAGHPADHEQRSAQLRHGWCTPAAPSPSCCRSERAQPGQHVVLP